MNTLNQPSRNLARDLCHLETLAFRRRSQCGPLLKQFFALKNEITRTGHADQLWNLYDWLLVPLSLWPLDFAGFASHLLSTLQNGKDAFHSLPNRLGPSPQIATQNSKIENDPICLLHLIDPPPPPETQSTVAEFERLIESGQYEKMLKQSAKFDEQEKALLQNPQLAAEWAQLKRRFDIKQFQNSRGIIRRRLSQERNFRAPSWQFNAASLRLPAAGDCRRPGNESLTSGSANLDQESSIKYPEGPVPQSLGDGGFHFFFDAFCYRWKLYGMEHDRPLLLKISINPTPHGTMIVIPRHWSLDPRRDLDWPLINRLHRSHGSKRQGPKLSPARIQRLDEAKKVTSLRETARKKKIKGEALHEFICSKMHRDVRSDPSWWKRLLKTH
jgi:hypothetical protein